MPYKELFSWAWKIALGVILAHPTEPIKYMRKLQFQIAREVVRTDNWGTLPLLDDGSPKRSPARKATPKSH